jgi:aryl-alcohol dehydrogenase-like predicted oxidoreductase
VAASSSLVPIPGTLSPNRLAENMAAADIALNEADLQRIDEILPDGAYGSRYPTAFMPQW